MPNQLLPLALSSRESLPLRSPLLLPLSLPPAVPATAAFEGMESRATTITTVLQLILDEQRIPNGGTNHVNHGESNSLLV